MNGRYIKEALQPIVVLVGIVAMAAVVVYCVDGCRPAEAPSARAQERAIVLTVAEGVKAADEMCAAVARLRTNADLARECARAYDEAREVLKLAESAVDEKDAARHGDLPCAVAHAISLLRGMIGLAEAHGGTPSPVIDDALDVAKIMVGDCRG